VAHRTPRGPRSPHLPPSAPISRAREIVDALLRSESLAAGAVLLACLAAIAWALLTFGELADEVAEGETRALDEGVLAFLRRGQSPPLDAAARVFSLLGSEIVAVLLVALLVAWGWRRRWGPALSLLAVTGGALLLNNVLKDHFQRARPAPVFGLVPAQHWSFPSGHAMVAAAFYLFLAYVAWRRLRGCWRLVGVAALVVVVALIGWSRLYLGVHYLTDVLAGYCAGAAWAGSAMLAHRLLAARRRRAGRG
jgi:undecaprenyl-diphosphatase